MKKYYLFLLFLLQLTTANSQTTYTHSPTSYPSSACSSGTLSGTPCSLTFLGSTIRLRGTSSSSSQLDLTMSKCDGSSFGSSSSYYIKWSTTNDPATIACSSNSTQIFPTGTSYNYTNSNQGFTSGTRYYILTVTASDGTTRYYSNVVTVTASTPTPTITVTAPNGGETYTAGNNMTITWSTANVSSTAPITIQVINCANTNVVTTIVDGTIDNSPQSYTWTIPSGYTAAQYRIKIYVTDNTSVNDISNSCFTINAPASTLTVTAPNGGETYTAGNNMTITWSTTNVNINAPISIQVINCANTNVVTTIVDPTTNSGSYVWSIPSGYAPGQYRMKIYVTDNTPVNDISDACFTINAPTPSICLNSVQGFGTTELETNTSYTYSATIKNNGDAPWSGTIYVKENGNLINGIGQTVNNLAINATEIVSFNWTPLTPGTNAAIEIFYQTNGIGSGISLAGCTNEINPVYVNISVPIGIDNNELSAVIVYPNPSNGLIGITLPDNSKETVSYSLMDMQGRIIQNGTLLNGTIDISSFTHGIYILKLQLGNNASQHKIQIK